VTKRWPASTPAAATSCGAPVAAQNGWTCAEWMC
jgi:hypothetical protein